VEPGPARLNPEPKLAPAGVIVAVRGSVVDIRFDGALPAIRTLLRAGDGGRVAIEVLAQRDARHVRGIALTPMQGLARGMPVQDSGGPLLAPVGRAILSRMLDVFGNTIDRGPALADVAWRSVHRAPPPPLVRRSTQSEVFETGLKVIDALIPIGRGQRELILGDRHTGKTAIALDTIFNQRDSGVLCVYCAIGQRASAVAKAVANLRQRGALAYTVVVVADGDGAPGLAYIAPYAATSIAEYFMEAGRDVLVVYDDLTHHARAYRELSLLLRRPPGREAFPGDIFYIHSRMLERATHLSAARGGGSLTALPIIETEAQNISAYIPTNLISITDGQIVLSPTLFALGVLPAVDVGQSVSRVGGKAQRPAYRAVAGDLKLAYAQFEELESFARFGARLDDDSREAIAHGQRIRACLGQPELSPVSVPSQIAILLALNVGLFDPVPLDRMSAAQQAVQEAANALPDALGQRLAAGAKLSQTDREQLTEAAREALAPFRLPTESEAPSPSSP
jgi:F-type H+-transporting ATPase subunit alpha